MDNLNVNVSINTSTSARIGLNDNVQSLFKLGEKNLLRMSEYTHNIDIFPSGNLTLNFNQHNFRIRASDSPNTYDVNIYDNSETNSTNNFNNCHIIINDKQFIIKSVDKSSDTQVFTNIPYLTTKAKLLKVNTANINEATLDSYNHDNLIRYIDMSNISSEQITVNIIQANTKLLYDDYFNEMLNNNFESFFELLEDYSHSQTKIVTNFPCIMVSSDIIYSDKSNFSNILKSYDFDTDYDTIFLTPIVNYKHLNYEITENDAKIDAYVTAENMVDDYLYNFTIDEDVLYKLGYLAPKVSIDSKYYVQYNNKPVYVIKGKYYSERIYNGPLSLQIPTKIYTESTVGSKTVRSFITLPKGYNILQQPVSVIDTFFNKNTFVSDRQANLSIPSTVQVKITQSNDVEKILNSTDNYATNALALGEYPVNDKPTPAYVNIAQKININQNIELPDEGKMYLFLTSPNQRYPLINSEASLTIEYV